MKIIFAGTPEFAIPSLQQLLESTHKVIAIYTQPDRPAGRGRKLTPSPVKQLALATQIPVYQPLTLRSPEEQQALVALQADVMVVIAYGMLLPTAVLQAPSLGCINVHASLLPRWRGAAPIQRALLAGEQCTGITIMQMDAGLDTGGIIAQASCPIDCTDTSQHLYDRLAALGAKTLMAVLNPMQSKLLTIQPQDNTLACYARKVDKHEANIDWSESADYLARLVRAFNPWPVAYTTLTGQILRIWQAQVKNKMSNAVPGTVVSITKDGIDVATGKGLLTLQTIQWPGGKPLKAAEFLNARSHLFTPEMRLGK